MPNNWHTAYLNHWLSFISVLSINLVPSPPARITTFILFKLIYTNRLYKDIHPFQKLSEIQYHFF